MCVRERQSAAEKSRGAKAQSKSDKIIKKRRKKNKSECRTFVVNRELMFNHITRHPSRL